MDLFSFKKWVGMAVMPLPIAVILLLFGLFALFIHKRRLGLFLTCSATLLIVLFTTPMLPNALLRNIEQRYPQYDMSQSINHILVLGCGHVNDGQLPLTSQMKPCSLYRIVEAVRIFQHNPQAKIYTSGSTGTQPFSNAEMNLRMLIAMGVPAANIVSVDASKDTEEEAKNMRLYLSNAPFALVTSASHMPRAMGLFEAQGMHPIAAPTDHLVRVSDFNRLGSSAPNSNNLHKAERWWYETLGKTWLWLKGLVA